MNMAQVKTQVITNIEITQEAVGKVKLVNKAHA